MDNYLLYCIWIREQIKQQRPTECVKNNESYYTETSLRKFFLNKKDKYKKEIDILFPNSFFKRFEDGDLSKISDLCRKIKNFIKGKSQKLSRQEETEALSKIFELEYVTLDSFIDGFLKPNRLTDSSANKFLKFLKKQKKNGRKIKTIRILHRLIQNKYFVSTSLFLVVLVFLISSLIKIKSKLFDYSTIETIYNDYVQFGDIMFKQKKYNEAKTYYDLAMKIDPNNSFQYHLSYKLDSASIFNGFSKYDSIIIIDTKYNGNSLILVKNNNLWGFYSIVNTTVNILLPIEYLSIKQKNFPYPFSLYNRRKYCFIVQDSIGKFGLTKIFDINKIECKYDSILFYREVKPPENKPKIRRRPFSSSRYLAKCYVEDNLVETIVLAYTNNFDM